MTPPDPASTRLDALASEFKTVVRRHDPGWTGSTDSDPGVTLLEIGAWITERIGSSGDGPEVATSVAGAATRIDPYRNYKFRVKWDGVVIPRVARISELRRTSEVVEYRDGSLPHLVQQVPGRLVYEPITLERPVGADTSFEDWADQVSAQIAGAAQGSQPAYRKNIRIEVVDQAGDPFRTYDVYGCWPSAYQALPDLGPGGGRLVERLTVVPEGWQRDMTVQP